MYTQPCWSSKDYLGININEIKRNVECLTLTLHCTRMSAIKIASNTVLYCTVLEFYYNTTLF